MSKKIDDLIAAAKVAGSKNPTTQIAKVPPQATAKVSAGQRPTKSPTSERTAFEKYFLLAYALRRGSQTDCAVILEGLRTLSNQSTGLLKIRVDATVSEISKAS